MFIPETDEEREERERGPTKERQGEGESQRESDEVRRAARLMMRAKEKTTDPIEHLRSSV